jgi:uncharacterized protein (TIGR00369 family)
MGAGRSPWNERASDDAVPFAVDASKVGAWPYGLVAFVAYVAPHDLDQQPRALLPGCAAGGARELARQRAMATIGATVLRVAPGEVDITLPARDDLTQQHGFLHGGLVAAVLDSACGYAALTLMPLGATVLTVEYKVNFVAPAAGERLVDARGATGDMGSPRPCIAIH